MIRIDSMRSKAKPKLRFSARIYIKEFDKTETPLVVQETPVYVGKIALGEPGEVPKKKLRKSPALKRRSPSPTPKRKTKP